MKSEESISEYAAILSRKMPEAAAPVIARWIIELKVRFIIKPPRKTKLGDFRPAYGNRLAQITVNGDLNPYNFLVTTVHEFAHLGCFLEYGNKVKPHGDEWKRHYARLLRPFMEMGIFPEDVHRALRYHISRPPASSCSCPELSRALAQHDREEAVFLADLKAGTVFDFQNHTYRRLEKRRTRYVCQRLGDDKKFLISGNARVALFASSSA